MSNGQVKDTFVGESSDEDDSSQQGRDARDVVPSSSGHQPAELFRKDLISAMKVADSEQLQYDNCMFITDSWRMEWEKGVQVPVNPALIHSANVIKIKNNNTSGDFKMPKKLLHATKDALFKQGVHELTGMQQLSEDVVRYDLDDMDVEWLTRLNEDRVENGSIAIYEWSVEKLIEEFENLTQEKIQTTFKTQEGQGVEYDEDIICDICRSPDSEDTNEMVFCDGCDICVHQACYGIQSIPDGSWLCRPCAIGIKPTCILCIIEGGAMKPTRSGTKWAHVSCALWIPEVSIGCVDKMEPITKISEIPASRWSLLCYLCKERQGACIQCSVKTCKTAFHVTCAFKNNLEMKAAMDDDETDVKLKALCGKHSHKSDTEGLDCNMAGVDNNLSPRKTLTSEEKESLKAERLAEIQETFYTSTDPAALAEKLDFPPDIVEEVYHYWKLKRRSHFNNPLLPAKTVEPEVHERKQEDSLIARMKMFVQLRQDLERVRNLCYMVSRREKAKREYQRVKEKMFRTMVSVINEEKLYQAARQLKRIVRLYYLESIYDFTTSPLKYHKSNVLNDSSDFEGGSKATSNLFSSVNKVGKKNSLLKKSGLTCKNRVKLQKKLSMKANISTTFEGKVAQKNQKLSKKLKRRYMFSDKNSKPKGVRKLKPLKQLNKVTNEIDHRSLDRDTADDIDVLTVDQSLVSFDKTDTIDDEIDVCHDSLSRDPYLINREAFCRNKDDEFDSNSLLGDIPQDDEFNERFLRYIDESNIANMNEEREEKVNCSSTKDRGRPLDENHSKPLVNQDSLVLTLPTGKVAHSRKSQLVHCRKRRRNKKKKMHCEAMKKSKKGIYETISDPNDLKMKIVLSPSKSNLEHERDARSVEQICIKEEDTTYGDNISSHHVSDYDKFTDHIFMKTPKENSLSSKVNLFDALNSSNGYVRASCKYENEKILIENKKISNYKTQRSVSPGKKKQRRLSESICSKKEINSKVNKLCDLLDSEIGDLLKNSSLQMDNKVIDRIETHFNSCPPSSKFYFNRSYGIDDSKRPLKLSQNGFNHCRNHKRVLGSFYSNIVSSSDKRSNNRLDSTKIRKRRFISYRMSQELMKKRSECNAVNTSRKITDYLISSDTEKRQQNLATTEEEGPSISNSNINGCQGNRENLFTSLQKTSAKPHVNTLGV